MGLARYLSLHRVLYYSGTKMLSRETERRREGIGVMQLEIPEHEIYGCGGPEELRDRASSVAPEMGSGDGIE
jgi:hypothetical protein